MPHISTDLQKTDGLESEILDINREFLELICHPAVSDCPLPIGLDAEILDCLRKLTPAQREEIAASPLLLAEFQPLPLFNEVRDMQAVIAEPVQVTGWTELKRDFANRLLTCLWQSARCNPWYTSLLAGIRFEESRELAAMSFSSLSRCAPLAADVLHASLSQHQNFWNGLIRAVRSDDPEQRAVSRLAQIPLSVSRAWASTGSQTRLICR